MQTRTRSAPLTPGLAVAAEPLADPRAGSGAGARWQPLRQLLAGWQAWLGIGILTGVVLIALFAPVLAPYDPEAIDILNRLKPPSLSSGHLLGTDDVGRDLLSRLLFGARISLLVGVSTIVLGGLVGAALGILAGYHTGRFDSVVMRIVDIQLAFPSLLLAIAILAVLGSSVVNVIVVLSIASWATFCRVARAQTLTIRHAEFVQAARAIGARHLHLRLNQRRARSRYGHAWQHGAGVVSHGSIDTAAEFLCESGCCYRKQHRAQAKHGQPVQPHFDRSSNKLRFENNNRKRGLRLRQAYGGTSRAHVAPQDGKPTAGTRSRK